MQRRRFISVLASGVAAGLVAAAELTRSPRTSNAAPDLGTGPQTGSRPPSAPSSARSSSAVPTHPASPPGAVAPTRSAANAPGQADTQVTLPSPTPIHGSAVPHGTIWSLPGNGNLVALTVDDGTDTRVVRAYAELAQRTGLKLTFFANGYMPSWTDNASLLRPLLDRGQVYIANHTWSHPDLTKLKNSDITEQVQLNERFLNRVYGVSGRPFLRPPYGFHNARTDSLLANIGYPTVTMWYGTLGDDQIITPKQVLANARKYLEPGALVIGHGNHPAVIDVMDQIVAIIQSRGLQSVHLGEIYGIPLQTRY